MSEEKFDCGGCCRSCSIKIIQENGHVYLEGNKCIGGEQRLRERRPEFADKTILKAEDRNKNKSFFGRLFASKR